MRDRDAASLAFKMAGLYSIIGSLPQLCILHSYWYWYWGDFAEGKMEGSHVVHIATGQVANIVLFLAFGIILIAFSNRLACKVFPNEDDAREAAACSAKGIQRVAFSVVGLYLLGTAIPKLVVVAVESIRASNGYVDQDRLWAWHGPRLIEFGIQLVIGLYLFLGARGVRSVWTRLRTAAQPWHRQPPARE